MVLLHLKMKMKIPISSSHHLSCSLLHFSTVKTIQDPYESPKPSSFIVDYLKNSCGFSLDKARKLSKRLAHVKSPSNPDSVLHFLKWSGFSDARIRNLVSGYPSCLCSNVEKTLKPKLRNLMGLGFSESEVIQLVAENPMALSYRNLPRKIEFWRYLLGTNENLLKASRRGHALLTVSLETRIMPNIAILRECGIRDCQIAKIVMRFPQFVGKKPGSTEAVVWWAEELGVPRSSGMFPNVLGNLLGISRAKFSANLELLQSLGWSEMDVVSAFRKYLTIMNLSEKNIQRKLDFFVKEVGCELSYLVCHPVLLTLSLERRLIPRHYVLRVLNWEELAGEKYNLITVMSLNEKKFLDKFVLPHKQKVPGL